MSEEKELSSNQDVASENDESWRDQYYTAKAELAAAGRNYTMVCEQLTALQAKLQQVEGALKDCHMQAKRMTWKRQPDHLTGWAHIKRFCERVMPELGGHNLLRDDHE